MTRAERERQRDEDHASDLRLIAEQLLRVLGPDVPHTSECAGGFCVRVVVDGDEPREFMTGWLHELLALLPDSCPSESVKAVLSVLDESGRRAAMLQASAVIAAALVKGQQP